MSPLDALEDVLSAGLCTSGCIAAVGDGTCDCLCGGRYHAAVWQVERPPSPPMAFSITPSGRRPYADAERYGDTYWVVQLADGREMSIYADKVDIASTGTLTVISRSLGTWNGEEMRREAREPEVLLALAPGTWLDAYGASVIDGSPVVVEELPAPRTQQRRARPRTRRIA